MTPDALTTFIVETGLRLGFARVGTTVPGPTTTTGGDRYERWLSLGCAAEMGYLARPAAIDARRHRGILLPGARTVVSVALPCSPPARYWGGLAGDLAGDLAGACALFARGPDYHLTVADLLRELAAAIARALGRPIANRVCVDAEPLLEKELAQRAGLGFVAKNTLLVVPGWGSQVVLGELLLDVEARPTEGMAASSNTAGNAGNWQQRQVLGQSCGPSSCDESCDICMRSCPTGALGAPYQVDARRCISYLTIEHKGAIPSDLRPKMGSAIFGCDACQQCCPHNQAPARLLTPPSNAAECRTSAAAGAATVPANPNPGPYPYPYPCPRPYPYPYPNPGTNPSPSPYPSPEGSPIRSKPYNAAALAAEVVPLLARGSAAYGRLVRGTALRRLRREQFLRNVCVALGNGDDRAAADALCLALDDRHPLVRSHAAWALGRLGVVRPLEERRAIEKDPGVLAELIDGLQLA
ncbi:MAG: QueG-associated DUF1730 domain-containing protein [Pseudomonadota bacterium]